ncbi:PQQ-binding-like beta-propeller repeat protein [Streptomyces sp. SID1034]|nr:PQQ-binding-like beta-propeller repeat protein [Streptomyces sp. SID1034]
MAGGTVYFACRDKHMYAVHADAGRKKWSYPLGGDPACPPTVADSTVYIGCDTQDSALYALDAADGCRKWGFRGGVGFQQAPVVSGGLVYATDSGGTLYAFDAANGTKKWSLPHTGETLCLAGDTLFVAAATRSVSSTRSTRRQDTRSGPSRRTSRRRTLRRSR